MRTTRTPGTLARLLAAIAKFDAHIGEIETLTIGVDYTERAITVIAPDGAAIEEIASTIDQVEGVALIAERIDRVFEAHEGGKIAITPRVTVRTLQDMRAVYTPGVARVSSAIHEKPGLADRYTWRANTLAIVSDGSRVLGLGDIGPAASLPVMEGKAVFYSMMVGINAVPLVLDAATPDQIVETVIRIAPGFGGIHLEDIASPDVYEVEDRLVEELDIPVMHDDQHGTAVVVMGAVVSAASLLGKPLDELRFGQVGLGAAGSAIARLATEFDFASVHVYDPTTATVERTVQLAAPDVRVHAAASMRDVTREADIVVLTSGRPGILDPGDIRPGQTIMALSNPVPEIDRAAAVEAGAAIATDGSIVNNVLAYPGLFRGALDAQASAITGAMKRAAACALADLAADGELLPDPLDLGVHATVAERVAVAADPPAAPASSGDTTGGSADRRRGRR